MYYRYIDAIVRGIGADATSLLDVGTWNARYLEAFDWIPRRVALDKRVVYSSENVEGITADFFEYQPDTPFDLVTCFQVLEHVPNAKMFAQKLFQVGCNVLISVPFKWKAGASKYHVHDPIDLNKLESWTERKPSYSIVVTEIFAGAKGKRLIAYYHDPAQKFDLSAARANMRRSLRVSEHLSDSASVD